MNSSTISELTDRMIRYLFLSLAIFGLTVNVVGIGYLIANSIHLLTGG